MKQIIIKITQWLTLLLSWLTISPLFVYLANKWKLIGKKVRILLLLVSPLMLIVYIIIYWVALDEYNAYQRKYRFANNEAIERITGVAFPKLDLIDCEQNYSGLGGYYYGKLTFEMENEQSESSYHYLDSIISVGNTEWSKCEDEYNYSIKWSKRKAVPLEEITEPLGDISLSFKKGSKILILSTNYMWIFDD